MVHIVHLITSLGVGGAETFLSHLLASMDKEKFRNTVITLKPGGVLEDVARQSGAEVIPFDFRKIIFRPWRFFHLLALLRNLRPDILQTWLYHADLIGLAAFCLTRIPRLVWNVRCSDMDMSKYSLESRLVRRLLAWFSSYPDCIIFNSRAGGNFHKKIGYSPSRVEIIENGVSLTKFIPCEEGDPLLRKILDISPSAKVIGHAGRYDPMKDHETFLRAAALVAREEPDTFFLMVGSGVDEDNSSLVSLVKNLGLEGRVLFLGRQRGMSYFYPALDIFCLSSAFGEGFPNVLAEAMACGAPCVSTDVGDAAHMLGEAGVVVPPSSSDDLAKALLGILKKTPEERRTLGRAARRRVEENFSFEKIVERYQKFYEHLSAGGS